MICQARLGLMARISWKVGCEEVVVGVAVALEVLIVISKHEVIALLVDHETYLPHLRVEVAHISPVVHLPMPFLLAVCNALKRLDFLLNDGDITDSMNHLAGISLLHDFVAEVDSQRVFFWVRLINLPLAISVCFDGLADIA